MVLAMNDQTTNDPLDHAKADLHAATRAVLQRLQAPHARQAERDLARAVYDRLDAATQAALRHYDDDVEARARLQAGVTLPYGPRDRGGLVPLPARASADPLSAPLSAEAWARLRRPFRFDDVQYTGLAADPELGYGTLNPILDLAALRDRLDEVLGPEGWGLRYTSVAGGLVKVTLRIGPAEREGFGEGNAWEAAAQGWLWAAVEFGIGVGLEGETVLGVKVDEEGHVADWEGLRRALVAAGSISG